MSDRIEPIRSRLPPPEAIPLIRRTGNATDEQRGDGQPPRKRRQPEPPAPEPPPDDGLPHIDVRV